MWNPLHSVFVAVSQKALTKWYLQYQRYQKLIDRLTVHQQFAYWRARQCELLATGKLGYRLKLQELGLTAECLTLLQEKHANGQTVVIGDIDKNGAMLSYFGPIRDVPTVTADKFLERRRFKVQLVAHQGYVGVRKTYVGRRINFVNELKILATLGAHGCCVPAIMEVDFDNLTLTLSYIAGQVLRDELALRGAHLHAQQSAKSANFDPRVRDHVRTERAEEGRRFLAQVVDAAFIEKLYSQICLMHAAGVLDIDIKYGNVIIEKYTRQPYWIDFDHATLYPKLNATAFQVLARRDIHKFNLFFGTHKPVSNQWRQTWAYHNLMIAGLALASWFTSNGIDQWIPSWNF